MIIIDPTEARKNSRLPQSISRAAHQVDGLEVLTGADILISPLSAPVLPDRLTKAKPHRLALSKHTRAGILVQRKHGLDLISSIPNLCNIQKRMMDWCGPIGPWLLVIGVYEQRKDGRLFINRQWTDSNYSYRAIMAALDFWQLRGGHVTQLHSEHRIASWLTRWHESTLHKLNSVPERLVISRPPAQAIRYEDAWWAPLMAIRGLGPVGAEAIANHLPEEYQSLAGALHYLTTPALQRVLGLPHGIGPKTLDAVRGWLGVNQDEFIAVLGPDFRDRMDKLWSIYND